MKVLKILGIILLALVVLGLAGGGWVWWKSGQELNRTYDVPAVAVALPSDTAAIARGAHLADAVGKCADCHGEGLAGQVIIDGLPFARVVAPNLTTGRGGVLGQRSDADLVRAIRHGVRPDGRALVIMPAEAYIHFSDADLGAIIAYLRTLPPRDSDLPTTVIGPVGRGLLAAGALPALPAAYIAHDSVAPYATAPDTTVAYGRYLAWTGGCHACHRANLAGGPSVGDPESPPVPNITPTGLAGWTEADFVRLLREGRNKGERAIDDRYMPWRSAGRMTDAEIAALWRYLQTVPPQEFPAS